MATKYNLRATNSSTVSDGKACRSLLPVNQWKKKKNYFVSLFDPPLIL